MLKRVIGIGIDLGGTMVRMGALDREGKKLAFREVEVVAQQGPETGMSRIRALLKDILKQVEPADFLGIGLGATGPLNLSEGTINNPYTLPTWDNVPIVQWLRDWFGVPVFLENDADMAALGEYWLGAGQKASRLYAVTVGTGIGTSFILNGKIYRGFNGAHPEGGHHSIDPEGPVCYCGARGCWEILSSGQAIANSARLVLVTDSSNSSLRKVSKGDLSKIDAQMVAEAALQGDPLACEVFSKAAHYLSLGLINIIHFFIPDVIVLSGGVMKSFELFQKNIQNSIQTRHVMIPSEQVRIVPAKLGTFAGVYGAAYTVFQKSAE